MMNITEASEPEDSHVDDLFGSVDYNPEQPKQKSFSPWHRPRKQFVREMQWSKQIKRLIRDLRLETRQIKYLGLPGDDLLDLRHFHDEICAPHNISLKYLGFNTGATSGASHNTNLEISLDEVNKLPYIDSNSYIIGDDFRQIGIDNSIAQSHTNKMGPFDVINIDLCDGFAQHKPEDSNHFNALNQLLALQARRTEPWLLLITTRTGTESVNPRRFDLLKKLYEKNLNECVDFLNASKDEFSVVDRESMEKYCLSEDGSSNIFLTSLCKWIITLSLGQRPPSQFELKSVMGYKVKDGASFPDLVSIAIRIDPSVKAFQDNSGLASQMHTNANEGIIATKSLKMVKNLRDTDMILEGNEELMKSMVSSSVVLLEKARYDTGSYHQWAGVPATLKIV